MAVAIWLVVLALLLPKTADGARAGASARDGDRLMLRL